jgi:hypothetical protein
VNNQLLTATEWLQFRVVAVDVPVLVYSKGTARIVSQFQTTDSSKEIEAQRKRSRPEPEEAAVVHPQLSEPECSLDGTESVSNVYCTKPII